MKKLPKFTMEFEPTTIEHLGLKLYVALAPVICELVSNAWDADAKKVEITLPEDTITPDSTIVITDTGNGMGAEAVQQAYLRIGRDPREETGRDTTEKGRALMGRKGLGKLSVFGIATEIELLTVRDKEAVCIRLNYDDMKTWPKGKPYEPSLVTERTGPASARDGTKVTISKLRRRRRIDPAGLRRELARRFTVIGDKFKVLVNGVQITAEDRRLRRECKKTWDVREVPKGNVVDASEGWEVSGWIGIVEKSSQTERGVDVFARGKAVELETMFNLPTTHAQFARAYVVGEINADFLDAEEDNIATARNSVRWESQAGLKLQEWGGRALKYVFKQWVELRRKEKEKKITSTADFDKWLNTRNRREQKVARKLVKAIVDDENIEPESAGPLLEIIKSNVEFTAFQELVDEIEDSGASVPTLLKLFEDWRVIEAREHLRLSDGRLEVMEKLSQFIEKGALEVRQIQPLFEQNGWLVNHSWSDVTGQTYYTKLLRKHCSGPKKLPVKNRRIDILGYEVGGTVHVVELKRPEKVLSWSDLEQVEKYVTWARANLIGTGPDSPRYVSGLLIVGRLSKDKVVSSKQQTLAGQDIRVQTYGDLLNAARKTFGQVEERLKSVAPEYSRRARRARTKQGG